ncbi:MAG: DUF1761 domain-containing protein [Candidatus Curtissbacteria bacterium]|nr:DUF1761 domain-containing protein [Candidatus Curtissbacteria bacterium]
MVDINYVAVLAAAISNIVIGSFWYSPMSPTGKTWMKLSGHKMDPAKAKSPEMMKLYAMASVAALVMAYVLAHILAFADAAGIGNGVMAGIVGGLWVAIGFIATSFLNSVLWEGKPWMLYAVNVGYYLVALPVMGAILAALG